MASPWVLELICKRGQWKWKGGGKWWNRIGPKNGKDNESIVMDSPVKLAVKNHSICDAGVYIKVPKNLMSSLDT